MRGRLPGMTGARWIAVSVVVALAIGVGALSALALQRARGENVAQPNPVPSFTLGTRTPTPTPTPEPSPTAGTEVTAASERFFSVGAEAWWRGTAGRCGRDAPLIERSVDQGRTWADVTPRYLGIAQIMSLDAFTPTDAEMVAAIGPACETQALRTFTQGRFWEPYPDVLAVSRYVDPAGPTTVDLGATSIEAPCPSPASLRASGDVVALVCGGAAWALNGEEWSELLAPDVVAIAVDGRDVLVAHRSADCEGVAITRVANEPESQVPAGCAIGADPASSAALAVFDGTPVVWAADQVIPAV